VATMYLIYMVYLICKHLVLLTDSHSERIIEDGLYGEQLSATGGKYLFQHRLEGRNHSIPRCGGI
jgi:hypothetical protein